MPVQPGLCQTWSETPKNRFLTTRLIFAQDIDCGYKVHIIYVLEKKREKIMYTPVIPPPPCEPHNFNIADWCRILSYKRASDSGARGRGFGDPHSGRRVVSLSKTLLPPKSTGHTQEAVAPSRHN